MSFFLMVLIFFFPPVPRACTDQYKRFCYFVIIRHMMFTNSQQISEINKKVWGQLSIFTEINVMSLLQFDTV